MNRRHEECLKQTDIYFVFYHIHSYRERTSRLVRSSVSIYTGTQVRMAEAQRTIDRGKDVTAFFSSRLRLLAALALDSSLAGLGLASGGDVVSFFFPVASSWGQVWRANFCWGAS